MAYVMSPTGIDQYRTCPRKFYEQYITKFIKWQATPAVSRGNAIHEALAKSIIKGFKSIDYWPDGVELDFMEQKVNQLRGLVDAGVAVHTEHELVVDKKLQPTKTGWWDADAWLRAKADVVVLPPKRNTAMVFDWKTGKNWSGDRLQLRLEALLINLIYKYPVIEYAYWYVDSGETVSGTCDFSHNLDDVDDIIQIIKELQGSLADNVFPRKQNKFCNWCILKDTEKCRM